MPLRLRNHTRNTSLCTYTDTPVYICTTLLAWHNKSRNDHESLINFLTVIRKWHRKPLLVGSLKTANSSKAVVGWPCLATTLIFWKSFNNMKLVCCLWHMAVLFLMLLLSLLVTFVVVSVACAKGCWLAIETSAVDC